MAACLAYLVQVLHLLLKHKIEINPGVGKIKCFRSFPAIENKMKSFATIETIETQSDLEPFNCHFWNSTLFGGWDSATKAIVQCK